MSQHGTVTLYPFWKRGCEFLQAGPENEQQAQDGGQLDHDSEHFPVAIFKTDAHERLADSQMGGGTDG